MNTQFCIHIQGFKEKFNKFIYYHWVQIFAIPQVVKNASKVGLHKFEHVQVHHNFKFTFRTCTTTNMNLEWKDFSDFLESHLSIKLFKTCALHSYLDLTHFLIS